MEAAMTTIGGFVNDGENGIEGANLEELIDSDVFTSANLTDISVPG